MCVEGLRAIPLGCSDCYDKNNVPEARAWRARWSNVGGWARVEVGEGVGAGARAEAGSGWLSL
jgi:hypothetical protein